jgi:hypothetical protein
MLESLLQSRPEGEANKVSLFSPSSLSLLSTLSLLSLVSISLSNKNVIWWNGNDGFFKLGYAFGYTRCY